MFLWPGNWDLTESLKPAWRPPVSPKCPNFKTNPLQMLVYVSLLADCNTNLLNKLFGLKNPFKMRTQWHISSTIPSLVNSILCCNNFIRINYRACSSINTCGSCCAFVLFGCLWHTRAHEKWNAKAAPIQGRGEVCWAIASTWLIAEVIYQSDLQNIFHITGKSMDSKSWQDVNCSWSLHLIIWIWTYLLFGGLLGLCCGSFFLLYS